MQEPIKSWPDLTYHFSPEFDIQLGGRESHINEHNDPVTYSGPFVPLAFGVPSPFVQPAVSASSTAFTYLVTPRYKISPDWMVYARLASGYRPGGPNVPSPGNPSSFGPDKTLDYEVGTTPQRQYLPPYAKVDLCTGVRLAPWTVTLYATNVADRRGFESGGVGNFLPFSYY